MAKQLISIRISDATRAKLDALHPRYGTQAEVVAVAIDRLHQSTPQYSFWRYRPSGEVWAVRLERGLLTGSCGPLDHSEIKHDLLPDFHYDDSPEDLDWIIQQDDQFTLA